MIALFSKDASEKLKHSTLIVKNNYMIQTYNLGLNNVAHVISFQSKQKNLNQNHKSKKN